LSYFEILKRIQTNAPIKDKAKNCLIIKIPNRVFFLLFLPVLIFSPKFFAALERIAIDLNGFTKSNQITGNKKKYFPIKVNSSKLKNVK